MRLGLGYGSCENYTADVGIQTFKHGRESSDLFLRTPPNTRWRLHRDYESPWGLGENSFDLIHLRLGCGSVSNWHDVYNSAFRYV